MLRVIKPRDVTVRERLGERIYSNPLSLPLGRLVCVVEAVCWCV